MKQHDIVTRLACLLSLLLLFLIFLQPCCYSEEIRGDIRKPLGIRDWTVEEKQYRWEQAAFAHTSSICKTDLTRSSLGNAWLEIIVEDVLLPGYFVFKRVVRELAHLCGLTECYVAKPITEIIDPDGGFHFQGPKNLWK